LTQTSEEELTPLRVPKPLWKSFHKKTPQMQAAITSCLVQLREDYGHPGLHTKKVQGRQGVFEARVDAKNRVTYFWHGGTIVIENHCTHEVVGK
jgi:hypothetical protein